MAKRRTKQQIRREQQQGKFFVGVVALVVVVVVIAWLFQEAELHPTEGGVGVFFAVLIAGFWGVAWWRNRQEAALLAERQRQIALARSREIAPYHQMGPKEFEHALAFLCERDGCTDVVVVGGAGDLGADVTATTPDGRKIVIQAKRYGPTTKVTGPDLQKFGGTCYNVHQAHVAAVVTTSVFTKQAVQYAGHMRIGLYDAQGLAGWASQTGPAPWH